MPSEFVTFETNIPQVVALAYDFGKKTETRFGDKMFYTLVDGRTLSVQLPTADLITSLGIRRNMPFSICKREKKNGAKKTTIMDVWLPGQDQLPPVPPPSPASVATRIPDTDLEKQLRASLAAEIERKKAEASVAAPAPAMAVQQLAQPLTQNNGSSNGHSNGNGNGNGHANGNGANAKPYAAAGIPAPPVKIPADIAFREVLAFVTDGLKSAGEQWTDQAKQDMVSTIMIQSMRDGAIGIWQRGGAK